MKELKSPLVELRHLVEIYYDVQDVRIRSFNRLRQIGEVKGVNPKILKELEKQIRDYIEFAVRDLQVYKDFLKPIKGIGAILAGGLLSYFDVAKADHASSFWKYAGLHVDNGKAVKRKKGVKLGFNTRVRTLCWKVSDSFLKQRTPFYRDLYDERKIKEEVKLNNPLDDPTNCLAYDECMVKMLAKAKRLKRKAKKPPCKQHIHRRAARYMVKRFLQDFWLAWRQFEGLPTSEPYAVAILKHEKTSQCVQETHSSVASHTLKENHRLLASHRIRELPCNKASHNKKENQAGLASHDEQVIQKKKASHSTLETQKRKATRKSKKKREA